MKRQSFLTSWVSKAKKLASLDGNDECDDETESLTEITLTDCDSLSVMSEESDHDPGEYDGDNSASTSTQTVITSASSDGVQRERRRNWYEVFHKKDGKQVPKRKFVRCKICISYPSIVSMHCYHQWIPAIATIDGTKYRQEVIEEHENHDCHDAVRSKSKMYPVDVICRAVNPCLFLCWLV